MKLISIMPATAKDKEENYDSANDSDIGIAEEVERATKRQKVKKGALSVEDAKKKMEAMTENLEKAELKKNQVETSLMMSQAKIMKLKTEMKKLAMQIGEASSSDRRA